MSKKRIVILSVLAGIFIIGLVIKNIAETKIAKEIKIQFENEVNTQGLSVSIDNIDLKTFAAKVILTEVKYSGISYNYKQRGMDINTYISCDKVILDGSYKDVLNIVKTGSLERMQSSSISFQNIVINIPDDGFVLHKIADNVTIKFDGNLTKDYLMHIDKFLPSEKQKIKYSISNLNLSPFFNDAPYEIAQLKKIFSNLDKIHFNAEFLPNNQEILSNFYLKNDFMELNLKGSMNYVGNNPEKIKITKTEIHYDHSTKFAGIEVGSIDEGIFSLKKSSGSLDMTFNGVFELDNIDWNPDDVANFIKNLNFNYDFSIEDLEIIIPYEIIEELEYELDQKLPSLPHNKITFDNISTELQFKNNNLINTTSINSSLLSSTIDGDVFIDWHNEEGVIKNILIKIRDTSPFMNAIIANIESELEQRLPRKGKDIVLDVSGTFDNPRIKGLYID